jgi:hypothetical protein
VSGACKDVARVASESEPDEIAERLKAKIRHADSLGATTIETVRQLVSTLEHTAKVFEHTAELADTEAARRTTAGRDDAADETRVAARARDAARRARGHADEWSRYLREKGA